MMKSICNDVEIEPGLQRVTNPTNCSKKTANLRDDACLDIRTREFWRSGQNAFFDVRITNNADPDGQVNSTVQSIPRSHEQSKKRKYPADQLAEKDFRRGFLGERNFYRGTSLAFTYNLLG